MVKKFGDIFSCPFSAVSTSVTDRQSVQIAIAYTVFALRHVERQKSTERSLCAFALLAYDTENVTANATSGDL